MCRFERDWGKNVSAQYHSPEDSGVDHRALLGGALGCEDERAVPLHSRTSIQLFRKEVQSDQAGDKTRV